jgi:hypothetical protein
MAAAMVGRAVIHPVAVPAQVKKLMVEVHRSAGRPGRRVHHHRFRRLKPGDAVGDGHLHAFAAVRVGGGNDRVGAEHEWHTQRVDRAHRVRPHGRQRHHVRGRRRGERVRGHQPALPVHGDQVIGGEGTQHGDRVQTGRVGGQADLGTGGDGSGDREVAQDRLVHLPQPVRQSRGEAGTVGPCGVARLGATIDHRHGRLCWGRRRFRRHRPL